MIEKESSHEKEVISGGCSAEDHATQEGQAAQQAVSSQEDQGTQHAMSIECSAEDAAQEGQAAQQGISNGGSAEDHVTQEGQAAQQGPDSIDINHKEDKSDTLKKEIVDDNIGVELSSSSSSEESLPTCRANKDAILRSIASFRRIATDDEYQVNGLTHDNDQIVLNNIKSDDGFLYAARVMNNHARTNSLASDMLVEVSEMSSPRSMPSIDEEYSGNEEVKEISSHPSQMDTSRESNSREVPEINDQQDISGGASKIIHNAEAFTSDQLSEKVSEENSINSSVSLSSSKTGLPDSTQTHSMNSNIEDFPESSEKSNTGNIIDNNLGDSETPINDDLKNSNTGNNIDNGTPKQIIQPRDLPESSGGSNSNSVNHQDLSESFLQNRKNEKRDYHGESKYQPSQDIFPENPTSVQSNHSLRSPENRRNEEVVSEVEVPASSAENEASDVVSEFETEQVSNISSSGSSPKSVLQPKFSSDNVSSMNLNQGTSTEYQQAHRLIVEDDSVLPVVDFNHSAFQNASPREDNSTSRPSHVIERLQSPRSVDALYCMPIRSRLEEGENHDSPLITSDSSFIQDIHDIERLQSPRFVEALYCKPFRSEERQNHDASISTSASSFYQDIHDPYPHQSNFNQEADTSNHIDNLVVNDNQVRTNLESVENIEGDNHDEASIEQSALTEPLNSSSSKSIEDTKEGIREINGQEGTSGTSKSTEGKSESGPDFRLNELHEATLDDFSNQPHEAEAKDSSVASKALNAVLDQKQTESSTNTGNLVAHVDIKEPSDPSLGRTMEEGNNSTANQNDPEITKSDANDIKSVNRHSGEAFEHVIRPEGVHNSSELDATSDSKSTAEIEGGLANCREVEN
ncbi:hypothetical protein AgCh_003956 [Apium graveolens]